MNKPIKVVTLGTSHGDPTYERFNTSTLLEIPGCGGILIDAGTPVLGLLIRRRFPLDNLKAVFITHMHQDHFGGLPDIVKFWVKRLPGKVLRVFLPEAGAMETVFAFNELAHRPIDRNCFEVHEIAAGTLELAAGVALEAIPTDHFSNEKRHFPSWAFKFRIAEKTLLFTGDLSRDFHDFPAGVSAGLAFCELTHYDLGQALPVLAAADFGRLVFTHIGDQWHGAEAEKLFREKAALLPYPAIMARDGDEFEL